MKLPKPRSNKSLKAAYKPLPWAIFYSPWHIDDGREDEDDGGLRVAVAHARPVHDVHDVQVAVHAYGGCHVDGARHQGVGRRV